ncbi:MAG TPA: ParB/RepB/Spo0J family partition protein [Firmicutes bacterium]|nr:ParB/RepB/Spo0J family partition protein [Bacillota bacterium]
MPAQSGWSLVKRFARNVGSQNDPRAEEARSPRPADEPSLQEIPVDQIVPNPYQPRTFAEPDPDLADLAGSVRLHGVLQPILVARQDERYVLVAGERRWRAAKLAGLRTVPALVGVFSQRELAEYALIENLQRRNLNCLEEAEAYHRLLEEFHLTQLELATRLGKSQPFIANRLRLLRLPRRVRESISREMISEGHARLLLMLESPEEQERVHDEIVRRSLSVRQTEELVRRAVEQVRPEARRPQRVLRIFKDARLFRNSLLSLVSDMKRGGAAIQLEEDVGEDYYEVRLRLEPARRKGEKTGDQRSASAPGNRRRTDKAPAERKGEQPWAES